KWRFVPNDKLNRRVSAQTPIPFANDVRIAGSRTAIGTMANCSGGQTPWGTFLTCEENYQDFYGETFFLADGRKEVRLNQCRLQWEHYFSYPPEHYGWVVEVDPVTGSSR